MTIKYPLRTHAHHLVPVALQRRVLPVSSQVLKRLKVPNETVAVIEHDRNTVFTMARRMDDLTGYPNARQKTPALFACDHNRLALVYRCIPRSSVRQTLLSFKYLISKMDMFQLHIHDHRPDTQPLQLTCDPGVIRKCTVGKQSTDVHTSNLNQAIVDRFLRDNLLPDHIRSICADYGKKMRLMLNKLDEFPEGVKHTSPQGGLFIWAELPEHINARKLLDLAIARKVAFVPGTHFCVDGGHENTLRLNFSNSTVDQIITGMDILNELVAAMK